MTSKRTAFPRWKPRWVMESPPGPVVTVNGRRFLYFGGTSYLGLHQDRRLLRAAAQALKKYGLHPATSRARFGNNPAVLDVENELARFFGTDEGFYYISGYVGNHILVGALQQEVDLVLVDEAGHFSGHEAVRGSGKPVYNYRSRDPDSVQRLCKKHLRPRQKILLLTDAINPSAGWMAPLPEYLRILNQFPGSALVVDDAHGVGILGSKGRGALEHFGFWDSTVNAARSHRSAATSLYFCGTLSKAFGGSGGFIAGSTPFLAAARQGARYFDAASAPDSAAAAASAEGLRVVRQEPVLRKKLGERVTWMKEGLRSLGIEVETSPAPIIGIDLGSASTMRRVSEVLEKKGIILPYVESYSGTGPQGLLRLAVFANHSRAMIGHLLDTLAKIL